MAGILLGAFRSLSKGIAARQLMRTTARKTLRSKAVSKGNSRLGVRAAEILEEIAELRQQAADIIESAYYEAMDTMFGMTVNPGQETVFFNYIIPDFADALVDSSPEDDWPDVDIGEYMSFMGEIVNEGNQIMSQAFTLAQELYEEIFFIEEELANFDAETGEPF